MKRLRVATYNIHRWRGMDGRVRPARVASLLREIDADVVALQEVISVASPEHDQLRILANELGLASTMGEIRQLGGGAYGNAVLSRFPLHSHCNYNISVPGRELRGCLRTDIALPSGVTLHLFNVHLGTAFLERRQQARRLLEAELLLSKELAGPRVVLGDFNEWTHGLASRMLEKEFSSADLRRHLRGRWSYPGFLPFLNLDHIYYDGALRLLNARLHRTRTAVITSDHLPLVAEFEVASGRE